MFVIHQFHCSCNCRVLCFFYPSQKGNFVNVVRKAQAAAWEEKFMAMKAKQKESNKVSFLKTFFPPISFMSTQGHKVFFLRAS